MALWILFCLFASVGLVQCGFWLLDALKRPSKMRRGYHIVPMYDDVEKLESQIRYAFSQLRQDGEFVLLVDMGLGEESQEICSRLICGCGGVYLCERDNIGETIERLDDLQLAVNVVE